MVQMFLLATDDGFRSSDITLMVILLPPRPPIFGGAVEEHVSGNALLSSQ